MQVKEFIATLEKMNFSLSVKEGKLILKGDRKKLSNTELEAIKTNKDVIDYIKNHKEELIEYISIFQGISVAKNAKDVVSIYRLSGLQQGMLFHGLYDNYGSYIEQFGCDLIRVKIEALLASWSEVIKRHSILRSAFYYDSFSVPVQCVYREVTLPVEELDYRGMDKQAQEAALKEYESSDRAKGFDFKSAPLMRLRLIRLTEDRYRMLWTWHHLLFDGWSLPVLMEEFLSAYEQIIAGQVAPTVQEDRYEDYIRYLERRDKVAEEQYWREYLKGISQGTLLPFIRTTTERTKGGGNYASKSLRIDSTAIGRIQGYVQSRRLTVNTLMQGAWALLLHKYTGSQEILFGAVVSGRPAELPGVEHRVGMYINTMPFRSVIDEGQQISEWLQELQSEQVTSRQYQYAALQDVQKWVGIKGDLFDSLLVFENYPVNKLINSKTWSLQVEHIAINEQTNYPLTVSIESSEGLGITFTYNTDLLEETYVKAISEQFERVLLQIAEGLVNTLKDICVLTSPQKEQLLKGFNDTAADYPKDKTIIDLFEEQAEKSPAATAVVFEGEELSYRELNERSNQLAHYLQKKGVKAETLVPICVERSLEMIVGIMGILKAGGAYVPIDPEYPQDRISYMLEDTGAKLVLSSKASRERLAIGADIIEIDGDWEKITKEENNNLEIKISPEQLAYVIYTSGSTGKPKGVMIEHYNVVRLFKTEPSLYDFNENDVWTMFHSFCFDFSVWEMYGALFYGGKLIIVPKEATRDVLLFSELLIKEKVTVLNQTPSAFYNLQDAFSEKSINTISIRYVIFGGEALNPGKLQVWKRAYPGCRLVNMYGITETTVHVTYQEIEWHHIKEGYSTIGKPIPTLIIYILDTNGDLVPIGVPGEMYVGGAGLARGYLNRSELTTEKFISDPFRSEEGSRLYKTGDLGRWLPDGSIEYLGRIDDQVKIRGYRIELGEIESALNASGMITQGVVVAKEDRNGNKRLVGYIVSPGTFDKIAIQEYLGSKLPDYMVPALWVELDSLPLTANGKIDRKILPDPGITDMSSGYVGARNVTEEALTKIWQEMLSLEQVGVYDNFFELGGHSLLAMRVVSSIRRELNIELNIKDLFVHPTIAGLGTYLGEQSKGPLLPVITAGKRPPYIPLSFSQERLWFIDKLEGSVQYHTPAVLRLKGALQQEILAQTLRVIIHRHEVLRTVILEHEGRGYQHIMGSDNWALGITEEVEDTTELSTRISALVNKPFDLSTDYMLRADLIRLSPEDHILVATMHHIASDGWSRSILVGEVVELYASYAEKRAADLPALKIQYADYAIWQQKYLQGELLNVKLGYWKAKLEGVLPLQLPADYSRPAVQSSRGAAQSFRLDAALSAELMALGHERGATLYMTLLAAFKVLLYRYSGQEDICVGTPVAGRNRQELEGLIGFFINTLALRSKVKGDMSFNELLDEVKATTLDAYTYQEVPFEKVVDAVVRERDMSRNPLFQVLFSLGNTPEVPELKLGELHLHAESQEHTTAQFDISFMLNETSTGIQGTVEYCTDLYKVGTIERMIGHYVNLLGSVAASPGDKIGRLGILDAIEADILLKTFNATAAAYAKEKTVIDLFEEQVIINPEAVAIVFEGEQLTYKELNERSNRLAHYLQQQGVKTETLVPIFIERGPEMVAGILGILKAGGAYVPIDPDYPQDRISYMVEDTGAKLVLSSKASRSKISQNETIKIVEIDGDWETIKNEKSSNPGIDIAPNQLAYVIYTSGSTGKPKGVMIEHGSLVNLLTGISKEVEFTTSSSFLSVTTYSFDICYLELYVPLIAGSKLIIVSRETASDGYLLAGSISANRPTHMQGTPSTWQLLADAGWRNEERIKMLIGGETVKESIKEYLTRIGEVWNVYGPTETTIWSTVKKLKSGEKVTIGKPIANTQVYILTPGKELSPIGVAGEICIGGDGLARGYLNRPELTKEKFIADPFSKEKGTRLYKTGDLGRWLPDGNLEHLGRIDDQVKIRGYRIELGEIESVLNQSEQVSQGAVLAKEDSNGNKRLVGYVVPEGAFDKQGIQAYLQAKLPDYMVPSLWVELQSMPLTPNGKTDRKALPDPEMTDITTAYVAPRNETETQLAQIWQELLGIERVGIHDNFFELGGHSLLAMRVVSSIRREMDVELNIRDLFAHPTVASLSAYLGEQIRGTLLPEIVAADRPEYIPLSFSQERLWFIDKLEGSVQYHLPTVLRLHGELNLEILADTLRSVINRHEVLSTVIKEHDGQGYQLIMPGSGWSLTYEDRTVGNGGITGIEQQIAEMVNAPFNLSKDYMIRANLLKVDDNEYLLVVTLHHIVSDGWSTAILVKEVVEIYQAKIEKRTVKLPDLPIQYADYSIWQRDYLQGERLENKIAYWKKKLEDISPLQLPTDYNRPLVLSSNGASQNFKIDQKLSAQLVNLSQQEGATMFMTILAAYNILLYRYSGQGDICVGTPVAGRSHQELDDLIGFFINTLALRSKVRGEMSFSELLGEIKETTLEAYAHQEVPYEKVVDAVAKERDMNRSPLFQVTFTFQNTPAIPELRLGDLVLNVEDREYTTAKQDISLYLAQTATGIAGRVEYSTDLYKSETIQRMISHFITLLGSIVSSPARQVGRLEMLSAVEKEQLLIDFNDTASEYPKDKSLVDLFEEQVINTPDETALIFEKEQLSYEELNERSNRLAHYLKSKGVTSEMLVPVCLERGTDMIVGILGIIKAGGAYVPIDPAYPEDRISYMLEDTGAALAVTSRGCRSKLTGSNIAIIDLDEARELISKERAVNLDIKVSPEQLAYVIYTSGSTGKPKGVLIEHGGVVNLCVDQAHSLQLKQGIRILQFASFGFDASCNEIFSTFLSGGCLVMCTKEVLLSAWSFKELVDKHHIEVAILPPSFQQVVEHTLSSLKTVKSAGEPLNETIGKYLQSQGVRLINGYGPTEATVCATLSDDPIKPNHVITIGKPISNKQIYILSPDDQLSPVGITGEISIGGVGLARGYLNRPDLTAEKFIKDPFNKEAGGRLYKTGDLARWLPDGNIEYLGRADDQVKIRGYRIELGEIESVLLESGLAMQAVVLAREDSSGDKRLIGYVVPIGEFDKQKIQNYLGAQLPDYMVPSHLVELQSMPLTANGKIDRKALPDPEGTQQEGGYAAPRNETEAKLAEIWQDILELDQVGINDDFFGIGGHSLLAVRLVSQVRKAFGMELPISDVFDYPTVGQLATRLTGETPGALLPAVTAAARPEYIPLSFSQERLWFIDKLEGSVQYHTPAVLRLKGELNREALEKTLKSVIGRHEVLRTVIKEHEGRGYQQIMSPDSWALGISEGAAGGEAGLSAYIAGLINEPFDLSADYMLRADLITLSADDHILAVTMHHIASDGWSRSILVREVAELYKGYAGNAATDLPLLNIQYADYAIWQRSYMAGELLERKLGYWRAKLAGVAALQLPTDYSRPPIQSSRGAAQSFAVDAAITAQLRMISQAHGATLYMTLLAAFKVLLYRYSGQEDICTGAPVAGRNQQELEGLIGFFVNTLALRDQVRGEMPFIELLQEVKATTLEAYAHQEVPFEKVVDAVVKERDRSRNPLFQVLFSLENTPEVPELKLGGLRLQAEQQVHATAQFDISFLLGETASGIRGTVEYSTDLYKGETIDRLIGHYISLLGSVVSEPGDRIGSLAMLGAPEEEQLLIAFNATAADYPGDKSIADLFEQQAAKSPEATAVVFEQEQISYKALNERSNQLARYLQKQGVKTETLVPICLERGLEMIIGILGILKAGGAYVPIDPEYPQDRIRYMLEDTGAELALSSKSGREKLNETVKVIAIDGDWDTIKNETDSNLQTLINPEQLAYVIYTSGSTGKPKGAMNEHGGVVNRLSWAQDYFKLSSEDTVLQKTTFCFDVSVWELLWPLLAGARLVFARPGGQADSSYLKSVIAEKKITMLHFVPSMLSAFLADLEAGDCIGLKNVLCSGEALSAPQVQQFTAKLPGVKLHNLYGPTEAAIDVTYWSNAEGAPVKTVPIGRPVWNTQLYILSNDKELCPVGVTGELYIGGVQVGRGYLNRPELTNEKFIKDPFSKEQGARLYKTGDLARWLPDGNIEYQGRVDDQVKIRGYRIELGEIESVLNKSEQVRQGLVLAKEDKQGNKRLVGYVVPNETFDKQAIQSYLSTKLPEYMVPAIWVELSSIPLTPNGKTDRRALPDPDITAHTTVYTAPRNETEADLAQTWQELLGLEKIGIYDNFFELGGDSILTIQVVSRMRRLGYLLQPKDIFNHQEIAGLSAVTVREGQQEETGEQGILSGAFGLLPIQSWYLEKAPAAVSHFNQSVLLKIDKRITAEALALAQNQLIAQHDALRLTFEEKAGEWQQAYGTVQAQLWQEDLRASRPDNLSEQVTAIADKYQGSLSVTEGRVVCMVWLQTPEKEAANRLLLIIHHLAVDGVSWRILLEDLEQLLSGAMEGRQVSLGAKSSSYRQWHAAIAQYSHSQKLQAQKAYWENVVNSYQPLPEDKAYTKEVQVKDMRHYQVRLKAEQTRALLQEVAKVYHTEINDLLLSALSGALCSWSGADQVVIGLEGHGREAVSHEIDSSRTVGWFTSLYPVELPGNTDEDKQIKGVKEALRGIPEKGLGYGVLKYLEKVKGLQGKDPWDVLFNYLGQLDTAVSSGRWLSASGEAGGKGISEEQAVLSKLSVNSYITGGELVVDWGYSSRHYNEGTVVKLAEDYINHLTKLIAHCIAQGKTGAVPTPSDYGLGAEISYQELDSFLEESSITRGDKGGIESISRLSGLQQGMLFHGLYDNYGSYIEQFGCDLVGVKIEALLGSWSEVIKRHSILRSAFYYDSFSVPVQCVYEEITLPVEELDYRGMDEQAQAAALKEYEAADRAKGFDFKSAPLMRLSLIRLTEDRYRMQWTWHHLLFDGWSLPVMMEEFLGTYELLLSGQALPVRSEDRYEDYIRYLERRDKVAEEQYWQAYLEGISHGTLLPFIRTTTERTKGGGKYELLSIAIEGEKAAVIQTYAQSQRLTLNTLMQGVWALLLHKYTGEQEVLFGAVVSGRPAELAGVEQRVGMYINTLPFKAVIDEGKQTSEWLQELQAEQVSSLQYQYTALQDVQGWTEIKEDLFDTLLVFENYPVSKLIASTTWSLQVEHIAINDQNNYPLTISIENSERLSITFMYNTVLLEEAYVRAMRDHFEQVLLQIARGSAATLKDISVLTAAQEDTLLKKFNDTAVDYPKNKTIVDLFEEQAEKSPEDIAVVFEEKQISYRELNERSNQLANYLKKRGVKKETLVPICIERGMGMIVGILGILKAGGAYVPIDQEYPEDRINYMLEDTGASIILSSSAASGKLPDSSAFIVELDGDWEQIAKEEDGNLQTNIHPEQLAYVIYTSGSTGKPKGVMIEHRGIVNLFYGQIKPLDLHPGIAVFQFASFSFDASCHEIFCTLLIGGQLIMADKTTQLDVSALVTALDRHKVELITLPPSYHSVIQDELTNVKTIISAGESLTANQATSLLKKGIKLINAYGPTENTVSAILSQSPLLSDGSITIGKPNANIQIYILDTHLRLNPIGVPGELYISGLQLARGYLNQPELTAHSFVPNPFDAGTRIYRTGDVGRWLPDGNIEYLGRVQDDQVKIRGYRIELGEIEHAINKHPDIWQARVLAKTTKNGKELVAYYEKKKKIVLWPSTAEYLVDFVHDDLLYHAMADDKLRNEKYRNAFEKAVKDKVILEVGPGSEAILSRMCVEAGAKRVYCIEISDEPYKKATALIHDLQLDDKIKIIHSDVTKIHRLPEAIDLCVSEIVGSIGGSEGAAKLINHVHGLVNEPQNMIPAKSITKIAAITLPAEDFDFSFSATGAYYVKQLFDRAGREFDFRICLQNFPKRHIISNEDVFEYLDFRQQNSLEESHEISLEISAPAKLHGFAVWLVLYCDEQEVIDTMKDKYIWLPVYFPVFWEGIDVNKGDYIKGNVIRTLSENGLSPDFRIEGHLYQNEKEPLKFEYISNHIIDDFKGNGFYKKIFSSEELKVAKDINQTDLIGYLKDKVPAYMIPSHFIPIEKFPVNLSGKIDDRLLLDMEGLLNEEHVYIAPISETEKQLALIWQELLEIDEVGIEDDFFELGGHSLLAVRLVSAIRKAFGSEIPINDVFDYPTVSLLAGRIAGEMSLEILPPVTAAVPRPEYIPLSFSQERLWFIDRLEGSVQYHSPAVLRLKGSLNREFLQGTLKGVINRHEVLRTVIMEHDGRSYQHIMGSDGWSMGITEELPGGEAGLSPYITALISKPFNLSADYMLRADLVRLADQDHVLIVTMHHIASDGWSMSIMVKEVMELYASYVENREDKLSALKIQYADYAIWQRKYMQGEVLENKLDYWKAKLEGVSPLQLPADYSRPVIQSSRGATRSFKIEQQLSAHLTSLSHQHGATLYMTLLAAFKVLLYRYSSQEDICIGTPVAGRNQQELEALIGIFINSLALRSRVTGEMTFTELLQELKETTLEAYGHQEVPFEKVVEAVVKERNISRSPLFQVMFSLENTPDVPELKLGDLNLQAEGQEHYTTQFDISFVMAETSTGIRGTVEYCTDLYREESIARMISHYVNLLDSIVASPVSKLSRLGMLDIAEEKTLLLAFNDTRAEYPKDKSIIDLFEEQVKKSPEAIAIVFEKTELSYKELNWRSNRVAHYLQKKGVKAETLVPICMERGLEMIVGILGIMKAGGAYVPVDPEYPTDRINYMLADTGASIILINKAGKEKLGTTQAQMISLDSDWGEIEKEKSSNAEIIILPEQLAYVIYTSGSTGKPKGVMIEHRSLTNYCLAFKEYFSISDKDKILQQSSISFDTMIEELYPALISGANIIIVKEGGKDIDAIKNYIENEKVSILSTTPTVIEWLNKELVTTGKLRYLVSGGEVLPPRFISKLHSLVQVVNTYGPSETTVCVSYNKIENLVNASLIGKPVSNTQVYIISGEKELSPIGVAGEICIGGAGPARGYLNMPELTAEKFIVDPFSNEPGARLFRTGDLGRWLPDGNIEYIGRKDDQVKIRGYRVELGEIESVLNASGLVQQAVVLAKEDSGGNRRLVGYVVPIGEFDKQKVQAYLSTKLPDYMVPALWVEQQSIPLMPNGKFDRKALSDPGSLDIVKSYVGPRNATETALAQIWQELLGLERVGIYDDFFELGGHSLLAMRVVSYIERDLSVSIPINMLFQFTTISDLSKYLEIQNIGNSQERNTDIFKVIDV